MEAEVEVEVDDDLSLLLVELSLFLDSLFVVSLFDSVEDDDFASPSLFASPLLCPLRA